MFKKNFISRPGWQAGAAHAGRDFCKAARAGLLLLALVFLPACHTVPPLPAVDVSGPGWKVREGQAVWKPKKNAPEIAGELLVATNPDGRTFVQFTKTPIPFVVAQTTTNSWQIHFVPNNKTYSGHGRPPSQISWLHLVPSLAGVKLPKFWHWKQLENGNWRLENHYTGESLEGYLSP
jgi:hypothetical protein